MSLPTLPTVQKLQATLHAKAKESPNARFYTLYDKVYRKDVLWVAYRRCLINGGAPGVDRRTFADIEALGEQKWLDELAEAYRATEMHARERLRQWLCRKHRVQDRKYAHFPDPYLHDELGLVRLTRRRNVPWATA
ncbi:MAG: hypothetical protein HY288_16705 [Planctomycetia bacterium]|nr:hypothetical protein [Planctomycetia bacterium]